MFSNGILRFLRDIESDINTFGHYSQFEQNMKFWTGHI